MDIPSADVDVFVVPWCTLCIGIFCSECGVSTPSSGHRVYFCVSQEQLQLPATQTVWTSGAATPASGHSTTLYLTVLFTCGLHQQFPTFWLWTFNQRLIYPSQIAQKRKIMKKVKKNNHIFHIYVMLLWLSANVPKWSKVKVLIIQKRPCHYTMYYWIVITEAAF